ncbi:MAG: DUF2520 domain-containing protein [Myxococcales bacterium]|nr:DUF2520 domain-containing protein [Myxococcales bacterium]
MDAASAGIVGAGRLGSTLALALAERGGLRLRAVSTGDRETARSLTRELPGLELYSPEELVRRCRWVFLTAPDDRLAELAAALPFGPDQRVIHCSGALGLDVLSAARAAGAEVGCLHPLQTFPNRCGEPERFDTISCGVEAPEPLGRELTQLAERLGARVLRLEGVDRSAYHAAAVLASNYVVALHAAAAEAFELAGLPGEQARQAMAPLTRAAAAAIEAQPLPLALTGPIARGDSQTVARQLSALAERPQLRELYRRLGRALLSLPLPHDETTRATLAAVLRGAPR